MNESMRKMLCLIIQIIEFTDAQVESKNLPQSLTTNHNKLCIDRAEVVIGSLYFRYRHPQC